MTVRVESQTGLRVTTLWDHTPLDKPHELHFIPDVGDLSVSVSQDVLTLAAKLLLNTAPHERKEFLQCTLSGSFIHTSHSKLSLSLESIEVPSELERPTGLLQESGELVRAPLQIHHYRPEPLVSQTTVLQYMQQVAQNLHDSQTVQMSHVVTVLVFAGLYDMTKEAALKEQTANNGASNCSTVRRRSSLSWVEVVILQPLTSRPLLAWPIPPVPLAVTPLAKHLTEKQLLASGGGGTAEESGGKRRSFPTSGDLVSMSAGYLSMDRSRKLVLLRDKDDSVLVKPLLGIWVSGALQVRDPVVWSACLHYLASAKLEERLCPSQCENGECFLLVLYSPLQRRPHYFEVRFQHSNQTEEETLLQFRLLSGWGNLHAFHRPPAHNSGNATKPIEAFRIQMQCLQSSSAGVSFSRHQRVTWTQFEHASKLWRERFRTTLATLPALQSVTDVSSVYSVPERGRGEDQLSTFRRSSSSEDDSLSFLPPTPSAVNHQHPMPHTTPVVRTAPPIPHPIHVAFPNEPQVPEVSLLAEENVQFDVAPQRTPYNSSNYNQHYQRPAASTEPSTASMESQPRIFQMIPPQPQLVPTTGRYPVAVPWVPTPYPPYQPTLYASVPPPIPYYPAASIPVVWPSKPPSPPQLPSKSRRTTSTSSSSKSGTSRAIKSKKETMVTPPVVVSPPPPASAPAPPVLSHTDLEALENLIKSLISKQQQVPQSSVPTCDVSTRMSFQHNASPKSSRQHVSIGVNTSNTDLLALNSKMNEGVSTEESGMAVHAQNEGLVDASALFTPTLCEAIRIQCTRQEEVQPPSTSSITSSENSQRPPAAPHTSTAMTVKQLCALLKELPAPEESSATLLSGSSAPTGTTTRERSPTSHSGMQNAVALTSDSDYLQQQVILQAEELEKTEKWASPPRGSPEVRMATPPDTVRTQKHEQAEAVAVSKEVDDTFHEDYYSALMVELQNLDHFLHNRQSGSQPLVSPPAEERVPSDSSLVEKVELTLKALQDLDALEAKQEAECGRESGSVDIVQQKIQYVSLLLEDDSLVSPSGRSPTDVSSAENSILIRQLAQKYLKHTKKLDDGTNNSLRRKKSSNETDLRVLAAWNNATRNSFSAPMEDIVATNLSYASREFLQRHNLVPQTMESASEEHQASSRMAVKTQEETKSRHSGMQKINQAPESRRGEEVEEVQGCNPPIGMASSETSGCVWIGSDSLSKLARLTSSEKRNLYLANSTPAQNFSLAGGATTTMTATTATEPLVSEIEENGTGLVHHKALEEDEEIRILDLDLLKSLPKLL